MDAPSDRFDALLDAARTALRRTYVPGAIATHMHVIAPALRRGEGEQFTLFHRPDPKKGAAERVKAAVNDTFGRFKRRSATPLHLPAVYRDPANDFDICDVRGKVCF